MVGLCPCGSSSARQSEPIPRPRAGTPGTRQKEAVLDRRWQNRRDSPKAFPLLAYSTDARRCEDFVQNPSCAANPSDAALNRCSPRGHQTVGMSPGFWQGPPRPGSPALGLGIPSMKLLKPNRDVGVVGYGAYVPRYRLPAAEVSRVWTSRTASLPITEKAVPGLDEDVASMAIEAVRNALRRARIRGAELGAVWVGSESHPYAVKPTGTIVAEAVGTSPAVLAGDWEFACKAGTEATQAAIGMVGSGALDYAVAVGMDTAQGRPGDALEYTAGAGGAALIIGPADAAVAVLEGSLSFVSDTPDFWRRQQMLYPEHGARFTGEPAYFKHVVGATSAILECLRRQPSDYTHVVFHQPNVKFPQKVGKDLGFTAEQIQVGLLADEIGNTYAGAAMLGLTAVLDQAKPGDRVLMVSFGSGAGSDAFSFRVTDRITEVPRGIPTTRQYIERRIEIDYATYARYRKKLAMS